MWDLGGAVRGFAWLYYMQESCLVKELIVYVESKQLTLLKETFGEVHYEVLLNSNKNVCSVLSWYRNNNRMDILFKGDLKSDVLYISTHLSRAVSYLAK